MVSLCGCSCQLLYCLLSDESLLFVGSRRPHNQVKEPGASGGPQAWPCCWAGLRRQLHRIKQTRSLLTISLCFCFLLSPLLLFPHWLFYFYCILYNFLYVTLSSFSSIFVEELKHLSSSFKAEKWKIKHIRSSSGFNTYTTTFLFTHRFTCGFHLPCVKC